MTTSVNLARARSLSTSRLRMSFTLKCARVTSQSIGRRLISLYAGGSESATRLHAHAQRWEPQHNIFCSPYAPYLRCSLALPTPSAHTSGFKSSLDSYCGLCIVVLYLLYLNVVKGALSVFDCSKNKDGVWILDADPSVKCYVVSPCGAQGVAAAFGALFAIIHLALVCAICPLAQRGGTQESMRPAAIASLLGYTIGLPAAFLTILVVHRTAIFQDQSLRQKNLGNDLVSNPNFSIRKRYKELYAW
jgi:hypothetical protein